MTLATGFTLSTPKNAVDFVWRRGADTPKVLELLKPTLVNMLQAPPPRRPPTSPIQIGPQYQVVNEIAPATHQRTGEEVATIRQQGSPMDLLSSEVIRFLAESPVNSGFHFTSKGAFDPPHKYKVRDLKALEVVI